jgi:MFS family permease
LGPRRTITLGLILCLVSSLAVALFANVYPIYLLLCFFLGLSVCFSAILPVQTLVLYWFNAHRALAMGLVLGGGAIGGFIYPQIISSLIINFGNDWRVGWEVIAAACVLGSIIAALTIRNRPEDLGQHPDGRAPVEPSAHEGRRHKAIKTYRSPINWKLADAVRTRPMWIIIVAVTLVFFLWQTVLTQTSFHLHDRGFISTDPIVYYRPEFIYGLILLFSILGRLSVSFLGEILESRVIIGIAGACLMAGGIFFWFVTRDNVATTFLFPLLTGFGFGATYVSVPLITGNYFGANSFPSIMSVLYPIENGVQFCAPFVAGQLYDINGNYGLALLLSLSAALIGTVLIFFCKPPIPRNVNLA